MAKVFVNETNLRNIGDAIREKNESNQTYKPSEMAAAIDALPVYPEPTGTKAISSNGVHNVKDYANANVDVPNSYAAGDEGKVVSSGALVAQTSVTKNANGTYDTTTNNEVVVNVPNSYAAGDEGKVVSSGALVSQGSLTITENDTYDTTLISELIANISGGGGSGGYTLVDKGTFVSDSDQYGIVDIDCGFEPDVVIVTLPLNNKDTTSIWFREASWAGTQAIWELRPAENSTYFVNLDRQTGETGIQAINSNGFSFMSNASNTRGVTCEYIAAKYELVPGGSTNILSGTDAPTANIGSDGDVYLQHSNLVTNVRMVIYETRTTTSDTQVAEVALFDANDNAIAWGNGSASSNGNVYTSSQTADKAFNGITNDKWYTNSKPDPSNPIWIDFEFDTPQDLSSVAKWGWYTGGDSTGRDPVTFAFMAKMYGTNDYVVLDSAEDEIITTSRDTLAYTKAVSFPSSNDIISSAYLKVSGAWQNLIGSDIDDVDTGN